jgi:hypothetical protein
LSIFLPILCIYYLDQLLAFSHFFMRVIVIFT